MKNHVSRPTGSTALLEANATSYCRCGRRCGRAHTQNNQQQGNSFKRYKINENNSPNKKLGESCYRCEMKGHWSRTHCTTKHLVDLYQNSIKGKEKVKTNFLDWDVD